MIDSVWGRALLSLCRAEEALPLLRSSLDEMRGRLRGQHLGVGRMAALVARAEAEAAVRTE